MAMNEPRSLALFRGQSRHGIGEGPGRPVADGEQYLAAEGPLADDTELLETLRDWMTLDAVTSDHRLLGKDLEAWSCLVTHGFTWVVRLCAAGVFDRRPAYFAHARALPVSPDPGFLLGRSEAFEQPWSEGRREEVRIPSPPAPRWAEAIAAEPEVATRWLASLYAALATRRSLLVAVPMATFVTGGPIPSLAGFARAALPPLLRATARIRIFTRQPAAFLRQGANLLVVPEEVAVQALSHAREALLLDRDGVLRSGPRLSTEVQSYAAAAVELALTNPEALLPFVERHAPKGGSLPARQHLMAIRMARLEQRGDPSGEAEWRRAAADFDRDIGTAPSATVSDLITSRWWSWWRTQTALGTAALHSAALAWLISPCWQAADAPEVLLEDWKRVLKDLEPGGLSQRDIAELWPQGRRAWPLAPPFELLQLEQLCRLTVGLAPQKELHQKAARDASLAGLAEGPLESQLLGWLPALAAARPPAAAPSSGRDEKLRAESSRPRATGAFSPGGDLSAWNDRVEAIEQRNASAPQSVPAERASVALAGLWRQRRFLGSDETRRLADVLRRKSSLGQLLGSSSFRREALPMHERVTFFYPRQEETPEPRRIDAQLDGRPAQVLVWSRQTPGAEPWWSFLKGRRRNPPTLGDLETQLRNAGGGLMVTAPSEPPPELPVEIALFSSTASRAARYLLLAPSGGAPVWRPLQNERLLLAPGQHLVIPVDPEAEDLLGKLVVSLGGLPRELSALILETITRPSLDYRLSVVEEHIFPTSGRVAPAGSGSASTHTERAGRYLLRPVPAGRLLAVLLLAASLAFAARTLAPSLQSFVDQNGRRLAAIEEKLEHIPDHRPSNVSTRPPQKAGEKEGGSGSGDKP